MLQAAREAVAAFLGAPSWREISFGANMTTLTFALARRSAARSARRRGRDHRARPRGQPRPVADARRARRGRPRGRARAGRHARPRRHGAQDRPAHPAGGDRLRLQRPRHGQRRGAGPRADARRRRLAGRRRRPLRAALSRSTSPRSTPTSCSARPTSSTARTSACSTAGPACSTRCAPTAAHPGRRGAVPDRDRHAEPRGARRRQGGGRVPRLVGRGARPARAPGRGDDRRSRTCERASRRALPRRVRAIPGVTVLGPGLRAGPSRADGLDHDRRLARRRSRRRLGERGMPSGTATSTRRAPSRCSASPARRRAPHRLPMYNTRDEVDRLLAGLAEIAASPR